MTFVIGFLLFDDGISDLRKTHRSRRRKRRLDAEPARALVEWRERNACRVKARQPAGRGGFDGRLALKAGHCCSQNQLVATGAGRPIGAAVVAIGTGRFGKAGCDDAHQQRQSRKQHQQWAKDLQHASLQCPKALLSKDNTSAKGPGSTKPSARKAQERLGEPHSGPKGPGSNATRRERRPCGARRAGVSKYREADERPVHLSLGLLPSGPDPVGDGLVRRQPRSGIWRLTASEASLLRVATACAAAERGPDRVAWRPGHRSRP